VRGISVAIEHDLVWRHEQANGAPHMQHVVF
jgi:hypothetical protein